MSTLKTQSDTLTKNAVESLQVIIDNARTTIKLAQSGIQAIQGECEHDYEPVGGPFAKCIYCQKIITP